MHLIITLPSQRSNDCTQTSRPQKQLSWTRAVVALPGHANLLLPNRSTRALAVDFQSIHLKALEVLSGYLALNRANW